MRTALLAAFAALLITPALAEDVTHGDLTISDAWSRETTPAQKAGAGYMIVRNAGSSDDRLVAAAAAVAERVELHTHIMEDGVAKMRQVEAIDVPAGGEAKLAPGGLHIMFIGLTGPLEEGTSFPLTLTFENAGAVEVEVPIRDVRAGADMGGHNDHGTMNHGG